MENKKFFKTPKGTEIPLLELRGKPYLQVPHRILWFREENPNWLFEVTYPILTDQKAMARAEIKDENGKVRAIAHKVEDIKGFADFAEKAETGAIGRALGMLGYGTQFAPEFDEGERLADSPVPPAKPSQQPKESEKKQLKNYAPQQVDGQTKINFNQANDLKMLGFKNDWTVDQMTESIKKIANTEMWSEIQNKHLPVLQGLFGKKRRTE